MDRGEDGDIGVGIVADEIGFVDEALVFDGEFFAFFCDIGDGHDEAFAGDEEAGGDVYLDFGFITGCIWVFVLSEDFDDRVFFTIVDFGKAILVT